MKTAMQCTMPPQVQPAMLNADFWLERCPDADASLWSAEAIAAFNQRVPEVLGIPPVLTMPDALSAEDVRQAIAAYQPPAAAHYGGDGQPLRPDDWGALQALAQPDLPAQVPVQFGLVTRCTSLRAFPTADVVTAHPYDFAFDRLQETTLDVGWPVALLANSRDGRWAFALTPGYWGWLEQDAVALSIRAMVAAYAEQQPYVMTTGARGLIALRSGGGVVTQMGTRLPLREEGQAAWRVAVPVRGAEGALQIVDGWIARQADQFALGTLPPTRRSLLTQAFRLLGEPYAWGGSHLGLFGRDCSRLVRDVYATIGVHLPRNADQQAGVCRAIAAFAPEETTVARKRVLIETVPPGAILVLRGHVMLYLGAVDGEPYVLHDTSSNGYAGVIVSDLSLGAGSDAGSLLARLTQAVIPM